MKNNRTPHQSLKITFVICMIAIILLTAASGIISYFITSGQLSQTLVGQEDSEPAYQSSADILVSSYEGSGSIDSVTFNSFATLLPQVPEVKKLLNGAKMTVTPVDNTTILTISIVADDPYVAASTANLVANSAPSVFSKYFGDAGKVNTINDAPIPSSPISAVQDAQNDQQTNVLYIVLICVLGTLSAGMIISLIILAAVYTSCNKKAQ